METKKGYTYQKIDEIHTNKWITWIVAVLGYLLMEFFLIFILFFLKKQGIKVELDRNFSKVIASFIFLVIFHEFLHYLAYWKICGINREFLHFEFNWKWMAILCRCRLPVNVSCYRVVLIFPIIITGLLSLFLFCFFLSHVTAIIVSISLSLATKDISDFYKLTKFNRNLIVGGHPENSGITLIYKYIGVDEI